MSDAEPPLTPSESALLRRDGEFMMEHAIALMSEAFVWGVYFLIVCSYTYAFPKNEMRESRKRLGAYLMILAMFFLATGCFGIDTYFFSYQVNHVHLSPTAEGQSLDDKFAAIAKFIGINRFLASFLFYLEFFIIDAYLIWRAWLLVDGTPQRKRGVMLPTVVLWCVNWFLLIAECITAGVSKQVYEQRMNGPSRHLQTTIFVLFYAINLYCTSIICYKAWIYFKGIEDPVLKKEKYTFQKVGNLLLESGILMAIYYTIQLGWFFTERAYTPWFLYITAWSYTGPQFGGLNITLLASVVEHHYSFWDKIKPRAPEKERKKVSTIKFGSNQNNRRKPASFWNRSKRTGMDSSMGPEGDSVGQATTMQFGTRNTIATTTSVITSNELNHATSHGADSESEKVSTHSDKEKQPSVL